MAQTHFKDYYKLLGVEQNATAEQIKRAYRKLAFEYHPDRNLQDREHAEAKFKEVTEAYGVLIDPQKRRQYDGLRTQGSKQHHSGTHQGFEQFGKQEQQSYEDLFQDLFKNPEVQRIFRQMHREFGSRGMRFDDKFFNNLFFQGRGVFFSGFFVFGPGGLKSSQLFRAKKRAAAFAPGDTYVNIDRPAQKGIKDKIFKKIGRKLKNLALDSSAGKQEKDLDLHYSLSVSPADAKQGTELSIAVPRGKKQEKLLVRVPAGTRPGALLRLRNKGLESKQGGAAGDLYLKINVAGS